MQSKGAHPIAMASAAATTLASVESGAATSKVNVDNIGSASPQTSVATRLPFRAVAKPNDTATTLSGAEVHSIRERRNWLIYQLYARQKYIDCLSVIETQLKECEGVCEYALFVKGLLTRRNGSLTESLNLFQASTLLNPLNPANMKQIAQSLLLLGKYRESILAFRAAENLLDANDTDADWGIQYNIGVCYVHLREYPHAEDAFANSVRVQWHECTLLQLSHVLALQGKQTKAIDVLTEALQNSPESPDLLVALGLLHLQNNNVGKSIDCFGRCLAIDSSNASAVMATASVMQENEDYAVALHKYRIAIARLPLSSHLWSNVGMCFFSTQNTYAAVACLRKAVALAPFEWRIAFNLGIVFLHMKQYVSAFHYMSASARLNKGNATAHMCLGVCLSQIGDVENARAAYIKALSLDANPLIHLNYAITLMHCTRLEESSQQFAHFMRLWSAMDNAQRVSMGRAVQRAVEMLQNRFGIFSEKQKGAE